MRRQKGDGVESLECSAMDEVGLRRASEQEHREGIDARITNLSRSANGDLDYE